MDGSKQSHSSLLSPTSRALPPFSWRGRTARAAERARCIFLGCHSTEHENTGPSPSFLPRRGRAQVSWSGRFALQTERLSWNTNARALLPPPPDSPMPGSRPIQGGGGMSSAQITKPLIKSTWAGHGVNPPACQSQGLRAASTHRTAQITRTHTHTPCMCHENTDVSTSAADLSHFTTD